MVWGGEKRAETAWRVSERRKEGLGGLGGGYRGVSEGDASGCASGSTAFILS